MKTEDNFPSLDDYLSMCTRDTCRWCGVALPSTILGTDYPHAGGWPVKGMTGTFWLYRRCVNCGYDWSLWKLGVSRYDLREETAQAIAEFALLLPVFVLVGFMLIDLQWLAKDAANVDYIANEVARCEAIGSSVCATHSSTIDYAQQQAANLRLTAKNFDVNAPDCTGMTSCTVSITYQYKALGVYFPAITISRTGTAVKPPGP